MSSKDKERLDNMIAVAIEDLATHLPGLAELVPEAIVKSIIMSGISAAVFDMNKQIEEITSGKA